MLSHVVAVREAFSAQSIPLRRACVPLIQYTRYGHCHCRLLRDLHCAS